MYILFKTNAFPVTHILYPIFSSNLAKMFELVLKAVAVLTALTLVCFQSYPECNIGIWLIEPGHLSEFLTRNVDRILLSLLSARR